MAVGAKRWICLQRQVKIGIDRSGHPATHTTLFIDLCAQPKRSELTWRANQVQTSWRITDITGPYLDIFTPNIHRCRILCTFMDAYNQGNFQTPRL